MENVCNPTSIMKSTMCLESSAIFPAQMIQGELQYDIYPV